MGFRHPSFGRWSCAAVVFLLMAGISGADASSASASGTVRDSCLVGLPPLPAAANTGGLKEEALSGLVGLGQTLFEEKALSRDGSTSCQSCHLPELAFAEPRAVSVGVAQRSGRRNAPSVLNTVYLKQLLWDGAAEDLESQIIKALTHEDEMGSGPEHLEEYLAGRPVLAEELTRYAPGENVMEQVAGAIGIFLQQLRGGGSAVDRYLYGNDPTALSAQAQEGFEIFVGKGHCSICHTIHHPRTHPFGGASSLYSDQRFHNIGVGAKNGFVDAGRQEVTGRAEDQGKFKTPMLRNVALTAPYMHDGSLKDLMAVVDFYDRGGERNPNLDPAIRPLRLREEEKRSLVAFLEALTSPCADGTGLFPLITESPPESRDQS
ncbi:cytochrome-c peroxidase [Kiloniella laminariae]|uniref:cytochrome-c peroxidase n=1 Tax=Kiloniella laminariae TaxID=454162 RepID=UPI0003607AF9|nr:cytochrome c peroxidase [Kiloniella laminariae]